MATVQGRLTPNTAKIRSARGHRSPKTALVQRPRMTAVHQKEDADILRLRRVSLRRKLLQLANERDSSTESILATVEELAAVNPNREVTSSPEVLDGMWSLVSAIRLKRDFSRELNGSLKSISYQENESFLRWLYGKMWKVTPAFAGGRVSKATSIQGIDFQNGVVTNSTEVPIGLPLFGTVTKVNLQINGLLEPEGSDRALVEFKEFGVNGRTWPLPNFLKARSGVRILYVDDTIRVTQGDQGTLFITAKLKN